MKLCSSVRILEAKVGMAAAEEDLAEVEERVVEVAGKGGNLALAWVNVGTVGRRAILR